LKSALDEAYGLEKLGDVANALYMGALFGARGNSGVILSQFLMGFSEVLSGLESFTGRELSAAIKRGAELSRKALSKPVEGTILTVMDDVSKAVEGIDDILTLLEVASSEAKKSVERTPQLLPVLKESGVVDAGGEGLRLIFEGALMKLKGEKLTKPEPFKVRREGRKFFGYCTEFIIEGEALDPELIRADISRMGDSVIVGGGGRLVKVHIHTHDPGEVISYGAKRGILRDVKVEGMEEMGELGIIAVVWGDGFERIFKELGARVLYADEKKPSVEEIIDAITSSGYREVIFLPNDPDIIPAAEKVREMMGDRLRIVRTKSIPEGISAMLAIGDEPRVEEMERRASEVITGEITRATRDMGNIKKGEFIGFLNGKLLASSQDLKDVLISLIERAGRKEGVLTIYRGRELDEDTFEEIREKFPHLEVEVLYGGQPHYEVIFSLE
ncbi:MAG: hypothetical protein DRN29_10075, partial [Thermoplasmata archaeon]